MFNISKNKVLLQELTCKQCSGILSVLPVYYCSAIGNICGRCVSTVDWMISNGTLEQAVAYEAVAKFLVFPCINVANGCQAKLKIDEVAAHEKTCMAAPRSCPFNINFERMQLECKWKGDLTALIAHLKSNHENHRQTGSPSFVMNISETHVKPVFTTAYEHTFLIITKYLKDTSKFYVNVVCCAPEPCNQLYRFQVEVGRNNDYFLILRKPNVEQFRPIQEIVNNDNNSMVAVDVNSLLTMLDDPTCLIYCRITIFRNPNSEVNQITPKTAVSNNPPSAPAPPTPAKVKSKGKKKTAPAVPQPKPNVAAPKPVTIIAPTQSQAPKVDQQHLEELECPVCNLYMTAPIYICPLGHSLCNKCKLKLLNCPICRTPMQDTRNYSLEQLTRVIKVPCCYAKSGCTVSLNTEHIKLHQLHCNFAYGKCPLKFATQCNTADIVDLVGHIQEKHSALYFETNRPYSRAIDAKIATTYWATTYENEIFIICCKHGSSLAPIKFAALHVGMNKSNLRYHFELEFCDQTRTGMKLIINQLCKVFPLNPSSTFAKCLSIPMEMLQPFVVMKPTARLYFKFILKRL